MHPYFGLMLLGGSLQRLLRFTENKEIIIIITIAIAIAIAIASACARAIAIAFAIAIAITIIIITIITAWFSSELRKAISKKARSHRHFKKTRRFGHFAGYAGLRAEVKRLISCDRDVFNQKTTASLRDDPK